MIFLLDTHTFIWMDSNPDALSPRAKSVIVDPANTLVLSVVCVWELQIKSSLGKISLRAPIAQIISDQNANGVLVAPIELSDAMAVGHLPPIHRDPFDRMLIAQATVRNIPLISNDSLFNGYPVRVIW